MSMRFGNSYKYLLLGSLAMIATLLSSCAPTVAGTASSAPLEVRSSSIKLKAGNKTYINLVRSQAALKISDGDFDQALPSAKGNPVGTVLRAPVAWYQLESVNAPNTWKVNFEGTTARRQVTKVLSKKTMSSDWAELVFSFDVPKGVSGNFPVVVIIRPNIQSAPQTLELTVSVKK